MILPLRYQIPTKEFLLDWTVLWDTTSVCSQRRASVSSEGLWLFQGKREDAGYDDVELSALGTSPVTFS